MKNLFYCTYCGKKFEEKIGHEEKTCSKECLDKFNDFIKKKVFVRCMKRVINRNVRYMLVMSHTMEGIGRYFSNWSEPINVKEEEEFKKWFIKKQQTINNRRRNANKENSKKAKEKPEIHWEEGR